MSVADQITRLNTAKNNIRTAIQGKGVTVPSSAKLDTYNTYINNIININSNYVSNKYALFYKGRFNSILRQLNYINNDADYGYCFYKHTGLSTDDWNWLKSGAFLHPLTNTKIDIYYNNMFQDAKITAPTNDFIFNFNDLNTGSYPQVYMDYQHMFDGINVTSGSNIIKITNLPAFITKACTIRRNAADTEAVGFQNHFDYMFANINNLDIGDDVILDFTRSNPEISTSGTWSSYDYCDSMFKNTTFNNSTDLTLQYTTQSFESSHYIDDTKTMFEGCDANSVTFKNIGFQHVGVEKSGIKNIYFNNCTYVASASCFQSAFSGNTALKSIDLTNLTPESSTYCNQTANMFKGCTALQTINFGTNVLIRYYNTSTTNNTRFTKMFDGCTALQTITNFPISIYTNDVMNVFGDTNLTNLTSISCTGSWHSSKKNLTIDLSKCTALNPTTFINTIPTNAGKTTTVTLKFAAAVYNALTSEQISALSSKNILYISA